MERRRSEENANDVHNVTGTEGNPEVRADHSVEMKDKEPEGQCCCNHNGGGIIYTGFAEEETVGNISFEFSEHDEDDEEDYCEDDGEGWDGNLNVEVLHRKLANFICSAEMTPQIVEEEYFRRWITYVNPSVKLDYDLTKRYCLRYYEDAKGKVKDLLNNMDKSIALSVDVLTHYEYFGTSHDFLCLTAHFIDDTWKLKKLVLRFQEHNTMESDFINVAILKSLRDWNILDKVANITSRGAHDEIFVSEVLGTIKDEINEKKMRQLNLCFFAVPCVAEMFSLMAQYAFNSVEKTIDKIKELSWSKSLSMWHTTNYKIKNALDLLALGEFDSESVRKDYDVPSTEEWDNVKIVHRLVERMHNVAKLVFETKCSTSNKFLYNLQELREILIKESNCEYSFTGNLAKKMLERLEKYLKDMFLLLAIASVMDPRLKMQYIEYISSKFDDINGSFQNGPVLEAMRSLYAEYSNHEKKTKIPEVSSNAKADEEESPSSDWFQEFNQFVQTKNQPKKSELDLYLEEPVSSWSDNFNTLQWWRSEGPKYPIVAKMARDILAIPLSVATSYDAYYYLENRHEDERVIDLGADLMNAMMCCWSWSPRTLPDLGLGLSD